MLTRSAASAEITDFLTTMGGDAPEVIVRRTTQTKNATYGTVDSWTTAHTYSRGLLWADTQRGQESEIGGRVEGLKRFKCAVLKDSFTPTTTDRLLVEGQLYEITGSNLGAVDDFCLTFDLVLTEGDN